MRLRVRLQDYILVPFLGLMVATVVGITLAHVVFAGRRARTSLETRLQEVSDTLASSTFPLTNAVLEQMRGLAGAEFALVDASGQIVAASSKVDEMAITLKSVQGGKAMPTESNRLVRTADGDYVYSVLNLRRPGDEWVRMHVLFPNHRFQQAWWDAAIVPLILGAVALLVSGMVVALIASRVTRPIHQLRAQVDQIAKGDFSSVDLPDQVLEIGQLSRAINGMARQLTDYEIRIRRSEKLRLLDQLGSGMAHQLRNHVTGSRMAVELHGRVCTVGDDSLLVANRQLTLMEEYLRRFLAVGGEVPPGLEPFSAQEWLRDAVSLLQPTFEHSGVKLSWVPTTVHWINGDRAGLQQVLINVLLNAMEAASRVRFSGKDSVDIACQASVEIREQRDDTGRYRVVVRDNGAGPAPETVDQMFEPLVTSKPEGVGLGLAICREIMQRHQGSIEWERNGGYTCFTLVFPNPKGGLQHATSVSC